MLNTALDQFAIPGDAGFPLNQAFEAPKDRQDAETLRQYGLKFKTLPQRADVVQVLITSPTGTCYKASRSGLRWWIHAVKGKERSTYRGELQSYYSNLIVVAKLHKEKVHG